MRDRYDAGYLNDFGGGDVSWWQDYLRAEIERANDFHDDIHQQKSDREKAADDMYDALWETIELSDRNLTEAGRTPECQRVYDIVRAALRKAEGK